MASRISTIFSNTNKMQGSLEYQSELMGDVKRELQDIRIHSSEAYWKGRFEEEQKKVADLQKQLEERNKEFDRLYAFCDKMSSALEVQNGRVRDIAGAVGVEVK